jgi:hypothetical protein
MSADSTRLLNWDASRRPAKIFALDRVCIGAVASGNLIDFIPGGGIWEIHIDSAAQIKDCSKEIHWGGQADLIPFFSTAIM